MPDPARRRRSRQAAVVLMVAAVAAGVFFTRRSNVPPPTTKPPADARPDVLLITVDTLRPDALGWVAGRNPTPAIDALANGGFRFPAAVSAAPLTLPSHASILTGLYPRRLGLRDNGQALGPGARTLAEAMKARGYATAAFVSGYPLDSAFGLDRGFDVYDDALAPGRDGDLERGAGATVEAATQWLSRAGSPAFAWVHFYDPHYPYEPPLGFVREGERGAYDGEVAYVDDAVGRLSAAFARRGEGMVVFAADHGESLGEHGEGTHGFFIYDSTVAVPLFFRWPGHVAAGTSGAGARLVDVTPTILDLLGLPAIAGADGVSLRRTLGGGPAPAEPAYVETFQPWHSYGWSPLAAIRHRGMKLIDAPRRELYDLAADPGEVLNVLDTRGGEAGALDRLLTAARALPAVAAGEADDPDARARLEALGYVSTGGGSADPPTAGLRDPKDGARLRALLTEADLLLRRGDFAAAVARFDAVLKEDPANRFALHRSGLALHRAGASARAVPRLLEAVRLDPRGPEVRIALAEALSASGRHAEAVTHWMEATRLQPRRAELWANLGSALGASGRVKEAAEPMRRAVELAPDNPRLRARLAFAELAAGRPEAAVEQLKTVAARQGDSFPHSGALGLILLEMGRRDEARAWLARSGPGEPEHSAAKRALAGL
jgi:choline-sulfatase